MLALAAVLVAPMGDTVLATAPPGTAHPAPARDPVDAARAAAGDRHDETATAAGRSLVQFSAPDGYLLGFGPRSVVAASSSHALEVNLVGANPVMPVAQGRAPETSPGAETAQPFTVTYPGVWEGVTAVFEAEAGSILKSTYYVAPGQDSRAVDGIRLRYNRPVTIDDRGNLVIPYDNGVMTESAPVAWQEYGGRRHHVDVAFRLLDSHVVGFFVGDYDRGQELVIDPSLTWMSFLGSSGSDYAYGVAVDGNGNVYVAGQSSATWGSPVRAFSGTALEAFVAKLNSSGNLVWNTFLGGTTAGDQVFGIAVDGSGNVYVAGWSGATWGSPIRAFGGGGQDAFVARLDTSGSLVWNTFLGGTGQDEATGIALDGSGNVYVSGSGTATWGSPIRAFGGGGYDAFAAKLNGSTGALTWNTFLGGGGSDGGTAIAVDGSGNAYVAGYSGATWGSPVRPFSAGTDAFAAKLTTAGALTWNTFLGGSGDDIGSALALDAGANVYIAGNSTASWGTPVRGFSGGNDALVVKLSSGGSLAWNTFLGGTGIDRASGAVVGSNGNLHVTGSSGATWGSPWRAFGGSYDAFVAELTTTGSLGSHGFLGGSGNEDAYGMAADSGGYVYVAGYSSATWGSPVLAFSGGIDVFVGKLAAGPIIDLDADDSSGATGADFLTRFNGTGAVAAADSDATVSNPANLVSLTVTLTNRPDGTAEVLAANTAGTSITASYASGTGVLTLSGTDTVAHYQQVLRTVTYDNTAGPPNLADRIVTFVASDGSSASNTATATVRLANLPPVNAVPGTQTADGVGRVVFSTYTGNPISISDPDAGTNPVQVTLTATQGLLTLSGITGLTFTTGDGTADVTMTFTGTIADINAALNGMTFSAPWGSVVKVVEK